MSIVPIKNYVSSGMYKDFKRYEERVSLAKDGIRQNQEELNHKRMEWTSAGVVGKYVAVNVYEYDRVGLNEYLMDVGVLPVVASINAENLTEDQLVELVQLKLPSEHYVRYTPNKSGRVDLTEVQEEFKHRDQFSLLDQVFMWKKVKTHFDLMELKWEKARKQALKSPLLLRNKKLSYDYGSFSLIEKSPEYQPKDVLHLFGQDVLIASSKVDMTELDEYVAMGFLKKAEIESFRKIINVNLRYVLIESSKENQIFSYFHRNNQKLSRLSQANAQ
jgi:hypothetical protein